MTARELHSRLHHPIVDADGHWLEYLPVMREQFRKIAGEAAVEGLALAASRIPNALKMSLQERRRRRAGMEGFWSSPSENVLDRATAMFPRLMYERLDDLGIDVAVVYPTSGLSYHRLQDTRMRRAICRAYNVFTADQFRPYGDRIIPAAIIPMYTPEEAIEELEFAATQLGFKVIMVGGLMRRPVAAVAQEQPRPRSTPSGSTSSASTATTTTIRCGRNAASSASRRPSIPAAAPMASATARPTSPSITSVTSPRPATTPPRRCSSAA